MSILSGKRSAVAPKCRYRGRRSSTDFGRRSRFKTSKLQVSWHAPQIAIRVRRSSSVQDNHSIP